MVHTLVCVNARGSFRATSRTTRPPRLRGSWSSPTCSA